MVPLALGTGHHCRMFWMAGESRDLRHHELVALGEPPRLAAQQPDDGVTR